METDKSNIEAVHHNHPGRWLLMGFCVALVFLCARVLVESSAAFDRGHSALSASDEPAAVFHFRTAAKWYLPVNPWVESSLDELMALGQKAQDRKDWVFALHVYDSARAAILGTRSFYTPHEDRLHQINALLPEVMLRARQVHPNGPGVRAEEQERLRQRFEVSVLRDHAPHPGVSLFLSLGFALWFVALFVAIWRGIPASAEIQWDQIRKWGALSAAGFVMWISGLIALVYV